MKTKTAKKTAPLRTFQLACPKCSQPADVWCATRVQEIACGCGYWYDAIEHGPRLTDGKVVSAVTKVWGLQSPIAHPRKPKSAT